MALSTLTAITQIPERSDATPGLWNQRFTTIDANFASLSSAVNASAVSIGSALTYFPPWSNATTRLVSSRLTDMATDFDFAGAGTNATDVTTAEQRALTYLLNTAGGQMVYPPGDRRISSTLSVSGQLWGTLKGTGYSYFRWTGASSSTLLSLSGTSLFPIRKAGVDGLWFHNIGSAQTATGLQLGVADGADYGVAVTNSVFQTWAKGALANSEVDEVLWLNNWFSACSTGVHLKKSPVVFPCSNHLFLGNYFQNCVNWGVDAERSALLNFYGNTHQTFTSGGVRLERQTALTYYGNYHELSPANSVGLSINSTTGDGFAGGGMVVEGNLFNQAGADTVGIIVGSVGKGVKIGPNQFFSTTTAIKLLSTAPQELVIDSQNFSSVTCQIEDQRTDPSRGYQFNIGAKLTESPTAAVITIANGALMRTVYKVRIPKTAWIAAATTQQIRIGSTPVRARIVGCFCDTTTAFAGLAGTITLSVGAGGGSPTDMILAHDVKSAVVTKGTADADLGTLLARATAIQGGGGSWSGGNDIYAQLVSSVGNIGTGAATNLTNGEVAISVIVEVMP